MSDNVHDVVQALARAVTPDEVDLAPLVFDAVLAGGTDAAELEKRDSGATLGGSGILAFAGEWKDLIGALAAFASLLSTVIGFGTALLSARARQPDPATTDLGTVISGLSDELERRGVAPTRAYEMSRRTLDVLLSDPEKSLDFLAALARHEPG